MPSAALALFLVRGLSIASGVSSLTGVQRSGPTSESSGLGLRDLVLADVPGGFGDTIASLAGLGRAKNGSRQGGEYLRLTRGARNLDEVNRAAQAHGALWGKLVPELRDPEYNTGCPMHSTPQKWWPKYSAERYFGSKEVFGVIRDPYERIVSLYREFSSSDCNLNRVVKGWLKEYLSGKHFTFGCRLLPQSEFFDAPNGISLPIDGRNFPESMNQVLKAHGYANVRIAAEDVPAAAACPNLWAGDLDPEAKMLIKRIYRRDFALLCKHFGHCDDTEMVCLPQLAGNCPTGRALAGDGLEEEEDE